ncbi:MAG: stage II sporulation protein R [Clostridia bacterium]|nr:stage II sporulation protein R [Clostridia bacterium]MBQ6707332.1 stage II sporulation protein R [Clostridia bacterium]
MKIQKLRIIEIIFLATVFFTAVVSSTISFAQTCDEVRSDVLRLHILANSDSEEDQNLKLKVRDAVLKEGADIFEGSQNVEEAVSKITPQKDRLKSIAEKVIKENGKNYPVTVLLETEYFETRTYEDVTLPAGEYLAVRILIGEGKGHNWWCVMFPPLCLPAATDTVDAYMSDDEITLVKSQPEYEPRFKIVEWFQKIFG